MPTLADIPVDRIGRNEVLSVLTSIWTTRPETARRVRQRIQMGLRWCIAHGFVEHNVEGETIDGALPPMPQVKKHLRSLPYRVVGAALSNVEASGACLSARLCLRCVVLTAAGSREARGATREGIEHRAPLSDAAIAMLDRARPLRGKSDLVFPSPVASGRPVSDMTLTKILRTTGLTARATVHGFRSSFKVWCMEQTDTPRAISESRSRIRRSGLFSALGPLRPNAVPQKRTKQASSTFPMLGSGGLGGGGDNRAQDGR